jgi:DNA-binding MarR family transcriptional regulator
MLYLHIMSRNSVVHDLTLLGAACLGRAARRTANVVTRAYNKALAPLGIEVTQFTILCTVALEKAQSASELADLVGVERSTLARNLDRLVAAGLVATEPGDGRRVLHRITDSGADMIADALPLWRKAQDGILARLPADMDETIRADFRQLRRAANGVLADDAPAPDRP